MSQKKKKYIKETPKYNLAPKQKHKNSPYQHAYVLPSFCDELPKGNHDSSSKGRGGVECLALTKLTHKA